MFPSGFSKSRSREQSAGEVFWWTRTLHFVGFIKFLFPPLVPIVLQHAHFSLVSLPYQGEGDHTALLESDSFPTLFMSNSSRNVSLFWKLCFRQSQHPKVQLSMFSNYFKRVTPLSPDNVRRAFGSEISPSKFSLKKEQSLNRIHTKWYPYLLF